MKKILLTSLKILSFVPLAWMALFISYVVRVAIKIGRLPKYDNPQSGDFHTHFIFVHIAFELSFYLVMLFFLLLIINRLLKLPALKNIYFYFFGAGAVLFILYIFNFLGLFKWYVD